MDVSRQLVEYAADTRFTDFPPEVVEATKRVILDTLGTSLAGSSAPGCAEVVDLLKGWGGRQESSILAFGEKVPCFQAAFANSMMAHARDFDDTYDEIPLHASASVLPAALAVAEARGAVTGKDLITAVVLGVDILCRMGLSIQVYHGWFLSAVLGSFGAAIAASRILGLDPEKMSHAFGIAYAQASGNRQASRDGALTKRMQPAFNAKAGVLSAYFANSGIVGTKNTLEGKYGFFNLYEGGRYSRDRLTEQLGKKFEIVNLSLKPYPCCRFAHPSIEAVLKIARDHNVRPSDIQEVLVQMPRMPFEIVGRPFEVGANPQVSAQFSVPYTVAVALINGDVELSDFEEENIFKKDVLDFAKTRVRVIPDERVQDSRAFTPVRVEIKMKDGEAYSEEIQLSKGNFQRPMSYEEVTEKFFKCSKYGSKKIPEENLEQAVQTVGRLEEIEEVGVIPRLLSGQE